MEKSLEWNKHQVAVEEEKSFSLFIINFSFVGGFIQSKLYIIIWENFLW